jgi:hypothetical protein
LDDSPLSSKKPSSDIDKAQRIGTPGETIPDCILQTRWHWYRRHMGAAVDGEICQQKI